MLRTFKARILILLFLILAITGGSVLLLVQKEVTGAMTTNQEQSTQNVLRLTFLSVESQYQDLVAHREFALAERKTQLQDLSGVVLQGLNAFAQEAAATGDLAIAQKNALAWLKSIRYRNDDYFFTYNQDFVAIAHPDPRVEGKDMKSYIDPMGNHVYDQIEKILQEQGAGFLTFWFTRLDSPDPVEKLGYVFSFKPWGWIIGTGVYIEDIQAEAERKKQEIVATLGNELARIRIAQTGYLFLFDGNGRLLAHPQLNAPLGITATGFASIVNPSTGNLIWKDLEAAAANPDKVITFLWDKPEDNNRALFRNESYVRYFAPLDWFLASSVFREELEAPGRTLSWELAAVLGGIFLLALVVTYLVISSLSRPLVQLARYTGALAANQFQRPVDPSLQVEGIAAHRKDEIGQLATAFLFAQEKLAQYIEDLRRTTAAKERIESELRVAHQIQLEMVPKDFPPFSGFPDSLLYASMDPAREVGGDLYDFLQRDSQLCFLIGDVSGKGVPAALLMATTLTLFRANVSDLKNPAEILTKMNRSLTRGNDSCMFVTAFCGCLDLQTGRLIYANAGHNPPFLVNACQVRPLRVPPGLVLGFLPEATYQTFDSTLQDGDTLFTYTDGLVEAQTAAGAFFGTDRLIQALENLAERTPEEMVKAVVDQVKAFEAGADPSDDLTLLTIRYRQRPAI